MINDSKRRGFTERRQQQVNVTYLREDDDGKQLVSPDGGVDLVATRLIDEGGCLVSTQGIYAAAACRHV